jgi:hypothetical protein
MNQTVYKIQDNTDNRIMYIIADDMQSAIDRAKRETSLDITIVSSMPVVQFLETLNTTLVVHNEILPF